MLSLQGVLLWDLTYDEQSPWPAEADGQRAALERIDPDWPVDQLSQPHAWRAARPSPGSLASAGGDRHLDAQDIDLLAAALGRSTSVWDLDGDGDFTSGDLVAAFKEGGYVRPTLPASAGGQAP